MTDHGEISKNIQAGRASEPWLQNTNGEAEVPAFDGKKALNELVDRDLSGVMRQLKQRIEQIVHSHEDATLAYQVSNLVSFYCSIFASLLGEAAGIEEALQPITSMAMEQFKRTTRDHLVNLHSDVTAVPSDLSPPDFLDEALETLQGLMKSYDTSFAGGTNAEDRTAGFQIVLTEALDPYIAGCENIAKRIGSPDSLIFAMNCLSATKLAIRGHTYTVDKVADLDETLEMQEERLVRKMHAWFVANSGMQSLLEALEPFVDATSPQEIGKVALLDALHPDTLVEVAYQLDAFLPTAMEDGRAFLSRLEDKFAVGRVCDKAADVFTEQFEVVERLLNAVDEVREASDQTHEGVVEDELPLLRDVFPRTSDEIKVLLS